MFVGVRKIIFDTSKGFFCSYFEHHKILVLWYEACFKEAKEKNCYSMDKIVDLKLKKNIELKTFTQRVHIFISLE